jgi:hypothetical protein
VPGRSQGADTGSHPVGTAKKYQLRRSICVLNLRVSSGGDRSQDLG